MYYLLMICNNSYLIVITISSHIGIFFINRSITRVYILLYQQIYFLNKHSYDPMYINHVFHLDRAGFTLISNLYYKIKIVKIFVDT